MTHNHGKLSNGPSEARQPTVTPDIEHKMTRTVGEFDKKDRTILR